MKCREMQYEEGKTYTTEGDIKVCENGFHACENPLDVLRYYPIVKGSKYHIVECDGDMSCENHGDSKFACREITVGAELSIGQLIKAGLAAVFKRVKKLMVDKYAQGYGSIAATRGCGSIAATQGDCSTAATQGICSIAATQGGCSIAATRGYGSTAATTGDCSTAATQGICSMAIAGKESVAFANGYMSKAQAALDSYIVLTEYKGGRLNDCKCAKVDGEKIKPDTAYMLVDGEFVEA